MRVGLWYTVYNLVSGLNFHSESKVGNSIQGALPGTQLSANIDRKWLHKSITRGHLKPGVLVLQCIIHLIIDFFSSIFTATLIQTLWFLSCLLRCPGNKDILPVFTSTAKTTGEEEEDEERRGWVQRMLWKQVQKDISSLGFPVTSCSPLQS